MNTLRIDDGVLEYWATVFTHKHYARYMTFEEFMLGPRKNARLIEYGDHNGYRPLLIQQRKVQILMADTDRHIGLKNQRNAAHINTRIICSTHFGGIP